MAVKRADYTTEAVEAAYSVLIELSHLLSEYRDRIVIVGGWVPELLLGDIEPPHIGSLDVDLALDHRTLDEEGYRTILQLLDSSGYIQGEQPFIFYRSVRVGDKTYPVEVDFLAGEYAGTPRSHRTQRVQSMQPRKARGCDLVFDLAIEVTLSGTLPGGGKDSVRIRVASIVPFLVMKAMALANRLMEKDAWDIYYCIRNYPGGIPLLAKEFHPFLKNKLVLEALKHIAEKFASPEHVGPKHVADFEGTADAEARALLQRGAYERTNHLLELLR